MNGLQQTGPRNDYDTAKLAAGTSFVEGLAGLIAVALSIIGLANIYSMFLLSVATIAVGTALLFEAGSVAARLSAIKEGMHSQILLGSWGGITTSFIAGVGGIALGILSLLAIKPLVLIPIAAIAYGSALITDSGVNVRLSAREAQGDPVVRETSSASYGIQVLVGLASITLGILALVNINSLLLSLVAMLAIGAAILLSGSVIGGRMLSKFRG
jgi:hypothetical protein